MNNKQCLYTAFDCGDLKAYLKHNNIDISTFNTMFDFYCDFLKHCPDRSIKDICDHIKNVCVELKVRGK